MIKPFMDVKTVEKIRFLHADDPAKARQVLASVFDNLDDLERSLGGNGEEYDFDKYGAQMRCAACAGILYILLSSAGYIGAVARRLGWAGACSAARRLSRAGGDASPRGGAARCARCGG